MENLRISIYCLALFILLLGVKEVDSAKCHCGKPILQRVIGGYEANVEDYPWLVAIQVKIKNTWNYQCVGALIHPRWVLTAAHCTGKKFPPGFTNENRCHDAFYKRVRCFYKVKEIQLALASSQGTKRKFRVSRVIRHPKYKHGFFAGDIALLKLSKPAKCGKSISLICLSEGQNMDYPNTPVTLAGWGRTQPKVVSKAERLRETKLQVLPKDQCPASKKDIFCTLGKDFGGTPCLGDSGGPLMYSEDGMYYITGVVSYGSESCLLTNQVMFTRVTAYMDWIRKYVNLKQVPKAKQTS